MLFLVIGVFGNWYLSLHWLSAVPEGMMPEGIKVPQECLSRVFLPEVKDLGHSAS